MYYKNHINSLCLFLGFGTFTNQPQCWNGYATFANGQTFEYQNCNIDCTCNNGVIQCPLTVSTSINQFLFPYTIHITLGCCCSPPMVSFTMDQASLHIAYHKQVENSVPCADIEKRSQNYTASCNGVVSHGAPVGGIQVFADHTCRIKCKQNAPTIFTRHAVFTPVYICT